MSKGESYDGEVGAFYVRPASHTKGARVEPNWRDPDYSRQNWAACRKYLKRYALAALLAAFVIAWGIGYGQGLLDGYGEGLAARNEKESN